ncbi:hypothetical protein QTI66_31920 [Variovorax sp. J22R133]|uniref:hypothetical protein n=1 Tax=Variovorax brevis TaxID=3053503 RepID=UPI002575B3C5|nr:hypothetical protein [Variovorax sp. J22R133]MDM0116745.1 hypothetical protein [Variovorax sp. J22R133]
MGLSSKLFLIAAQDALEALAAAAFMRMLRQESISRLPDFAGRRVRLASLIVELANRTPLRVVYRNFSVLDINAQGLLDVDRLNTQQVARIPDLLVPDSQSSATRAPVIDAANRFIARGGSWQPDELLLRRIDAAALGHLPCRRVRVLR